MLACRSDVGSFVPITPENRTHAEVALGATGAPFPPVEPIGYVGACGGCDAGPGRLRGPGIRRYPLRAILHCLVNLLRQLSVHYR